MALSKRQGHNSVGKPTISVAAERTAQSLAGERRALMARRAGLAGAVALPVIIIAGLLLFFRPFAPASPGTAAPAAPALATAAPVVQPTAVPAAAAPVVQPSAAPGATAVPQPAAAPAAGAIVCDAIGGLPVYAGASCTERDLDHDDGLIKAKNTYAIAASADDVRRFYEGAFATNGWTVQESAYDGQDIAWKYTVARGQQRLKVEVESQAGPNGAYTRIKIEEK